jgi:predicted ATP-grasp superfamily ATP-dependent carboligase
MNNIEDYQNLVEVLKSALNFYAKASVEEMTIDGGFQARFALSKIDEVNAQYEKMKKEYDDSLMIDDEDAMLNKLENELENLKKIWKQSNLKS